jgi:hypothetical protein
VHNKDEASNLYQEHGWLFNVRKRKELYYDKGSPEIVIVSNKGLRTMNRKEKL